MSTSSSSGGPGLLTIVLVVLIVLKLAKVGDVAEWSWWWVLSPMWVPLVLLIGFHGTAAVVRSIGVWLDQRAVLRRAMRGDE